jgi:hypothetical protein
VGKTFASCLLTVVSEGKYKEAIKVYDQLLSLTKKPAALYNKVSYCGMTENLPFRAVR